MSHLSELRRLVGDRLLLVPGAQVLALDGGDRVLLQRATDTGRWGLPAGACEPGQGFAAAAVAELREETGLLTTEADLTAFASLSDPGVHTLTYPNGDVTHCFALCFEARTWTGALRPQPGEVEEVAFFPRGGLPGDLHPPTRVVLEMHAGWRRDGVFRAG
ncbi:hydrolase acting on acid anhydrides in phosphorous-containing anhydrides [Actinorhabdospora filicis]|uniref:Hydrolase acting on acid anhydrides in phosphorous-containing anhydrides n=1 Tax=Actinorhabdospora filicis TaxID=1785913 RepID=A0A9W6SPG9_9ACTN|nr:NUDIX domain-containing protein [Actinorhabdospora filicis]GLZ79968.1 hydrolase acting on acid anhydrides in phosphorous-containing anhydrides [Actinorhabdospora filicis]